ncbi:MAG: site-specific DNA-methyltransferase [Bacteroidota bacterium]
MATQKMKLAYKTKLGECFVTKLERALLSDRFKRLAGKVDLILTSPPFPLKRQKRYGNLNGEAYLEWLSLIAADLKQLLKPRGSIVIEMGNAWEEHAPSMSTVPIKALLRFLEAGQFHLCQQFVWYNTAKLPGPAQWVTIERSRVKDAFTHLWWMSKTGRPKADNRRVLVAYSRSMQRLLKTKRYNSGMRPSQHNIGEKSFLKDNGGAIPSNVIIAANTNSSSNYYEYCKALCLPVHPARMATDVVEFFIELLTRPGDLVFDPFAGSNTTGFCAEKMHRKWIAVESDETYVKGSYGRFVQKGAFR